ncbi:hypothetical protein BJX63DRAFT_160368 [Aspergillus granulosus]|uniref:DUF1917-domain-containing protein n=1 Tax=Aspergillus granulosus TaxID=176169 RepID=A0ABR4HL82_9EURO
MADRKADDILSDDSSFYGKFFEKVGAIFNKLTTGDEEETARLEQREIEYEDEYWTTIHPHLLSTIQERTRFEQNSLVKKKMSPTPMDIDEPKCMPVNKLGPGEPSSAFLARLPASTTRAENVGPWIYLHTPSAYQREGDVPTLQRKGLEALYAYEAEEARLRQENDQKGGSNIALSRKLSPLRRELETRLFALAQEMNVVTGKWLLFMTPDRVDLFWRAVVEGTLRGELGHAAKVATDADDGQGRARLICIYTKDYRDREDIKRVLMRLMELGLVRKGDMPIYYKCDVLTYLEIKSGNKYGLKPALLSSADVLNRQI